MNTLLIGALLLGNLTVTSYQSLESQTDSTPFITSTGEHVSRHGVALSRDLLRRWNGPVSYGDLIFIEGYGFKIVTDCMHQRKTMQVDIWVSTHAEEKAIGVRKGKVWLIKIKGD